MQPGCSWTSTRATDLELAQHVVQRRLQIRLRVPLADDQRAPDLKRAGGEVLRPGAGHDDGVGRDVAAILDRLGTRHVDHGHRRGERDVRREHGALADQHALGEDAARADERSVLDDHGPCLHRLEHAADADAAGEMDVGADLSARADGRPRVDHRVRPDPGADVHVARHHHDAGREVRAVARSRRRNDAHAQRRIVALQRNLVEILVRSDLDRLQLADAEVIEDRRLRVLVHAPLAVDLLRDAQLAAVERRDRLFSRQSSSRIAAARSHSSSVGTSAKRT